MLFGGTPGLWEACRGRRALLTVRCLRKCRSATSDSRRDGARRHLAKPAPAPQPRAQPAPFPAQSSSDAGQAPPQAPRFQFRNARGGVPRGPCCQGLSAREELGRARRCAVTQLAFYRPHLDPGRHLHFHCGVPRCDGRLLGLLAPFSAIFAAFSPPSVATKRERQRRQPVKAPEKAHSKHRERFTSSSSQQTPTPLYLGVVPASTCAARAYKTLLDWCTSAIKNLHSSTGGSPTLPQSTTPGTGTR